MMTTMTLLMILAIGVLSISTQIANRRTVAVRRQARTRRPRVL